MSQRRLLTFANLDDLMPEVDRLLRSGYECAGNWGLGQVCHHLSRAIVGSVEGIPFGAPWIVQISIGPILRRSLLRSRRMPNGMPLPKRLAPSPELDDRAEAEALRAAVAALARHAGPMANHPFFGRMTMDQWRQFHAIHGAHHLGFLVPNAAVAVG